MERAGLLKVALMTVLTLLAAACGQAAAVHAELDGTLSIWYPDGYVAEDAASDAVADVGTTGADAVADTVADAADATADALPDLPDATTPDGLADAVTADVLADAADAPDVPDVADVADLADSPDVVVVPDVTAADTGPPGVCFKGAPPSGDAFVADIAATDPTTCPTTALPATWFATPPAPTLIVTPGFLGAGDAFVAYKDNDWAPVIYGMQGSFHVWAGFTVDGIPNATAPTLPLDVQIWGETSCVTVASGVAAKVATVPTASGAYTNLFVGSSGVPTQFYVPAASSYLYCGIWLDLHIRIHDPVSNAWGEAVRTLRIYDSKP